MRCRRSWDWRRRSWQQEFHLCTTAHCQSRNWYFCLLFDLLKHCFNQTTGSTWWRGRIVRRILTMTLMIWLRTPGTLSSLPRGILAKRGVCSENLVWSCFSVMPDNINQHQCITVHWKMFPSKLVDMSDWADIDEKRRTRRQKRTDKRRKGRQGGRSKTSRYYCSLHASMITMEDVALNGGDWTSSLYSGNLSLNLCRVCA